MKRFTRCRGDASKNTQRTNRSKRIPKKHDAAVVIQRHVRGFTAKKGYERCRENVIRMQSFYRAQRAALEANVKYNMALVIQAAARGWQVRRMVRVQSVAVLKPEMLSRVFSP